MHHPEAPGGPSREGEHQANINMGSGAARAPSRSTKREGHNREGGGEGESHPAPPLTTTIATSLQCLPPLPSPPLLTMMTAASAAPGCSATAGAA